MKRIVRTNRPEPTDREAYLENALECMRIAKEGIKVQLENLRGQSKELAAHNIRLRNEASSLQKLPIDLVMDREEYARPQDAPGNSLVIRDRHSGRIIEGVIGANLETSYEKKPHSVHYKREESQVGESVETFTALRLVIRYGGVPPRPELLRGLRGVW